jgi:hypothetical protein
VDRRQRQMCIRDSQNPVSEICEERLDLMM